jgi:hypothetical protein
MIPWFPQKIFPGTPAVAGMLAPLPLLVVLVLLHPAICRAEEDDEEQTCGAASGEDCGLRPDPCSALPPRADAESGLVISDQRAVAAQQLAESGTPPGHELKYYLLGSPVNHSPSPQLHNAGFGACSLRHTYTARETSSVDGLSELLQAPRFGGASVTIPLKVDIVPLLDRLSDEATAIGAVNTIVRTTGGDLVGDNTDWLGILRPVKAALQRRRLHQEGPDVQDKTGIALVVGAGGTARAAAFAARELGLGLLVWNRSYQNAEALASAFKGQRQHVPPPAALPPAASQLPFTTWCAASPGQVCPSQHWRRQRKWPTPRRLS